MCFLMFEEIKFQEAHSFVSPPTVWERRLATGLVLASWLISRLLCASPTRFCIFFILQAWAAKVNMSNILLFLSLVFTPLGLSSLDHDPSHQKSSIFMASLERRKTPLCRGTTH